MGYRITAIITYNGLGELLINSAEEYKEIKLDVVYGTQMNCIALAEKAASDNCDMFMAQNGIADILKENGYPVTEIETGVGELLKTIRNIGKVNGRTAVISNHELESAKELLSDGYGERIDFYSSETNEGLAEILEKCAADSYSAIICDNAADTVGKRMGINTYLIIPDRSSVEKAIRNAVSVCRMTVEYKKRSLLYAGILENQNEAVIILKADGSLFYSSVAQAQAEVLDFLRYEIAGTLKSGYRRIKHTINRVHYEITAHAIHYNGEALAEYHLIEQSLAAASTSGIIYQSINEVEDQFENSPFNTINIDKELREAIIRGADTDAPIMITGEDGTGKPTVAAMLYARGHYRMNSFVTINCAQLTKKSISFLLRNAASPLLFKNSSLYFQNLDLLSPEQCEEIMAGIMEFNTQKRNLVCFSSIQREGEALSPNGAFFREALDCLTLHVPSIRSLKDSIPTMVQLSINHYNTTSMQQVRYIEPEAIKLLCEFGWPYNLTQFNRVVRDLVLNAVDGKITEAQTEMMLNQERNPGTFFNMMDDTQTPINLKKTLEDINRDIAKLVMEQMNGNHSAAARSLGISRTTLWRLLR